ncbi:hypothetical protein QAD02_009016 [Eretmocerus hayati]|uniref:Uncharacterized protein n=1 Tax=Eretmocerus hayati TaxID=131215 RepID=A0ACC2NAJ7_9HYME|nr:hypothetical protein QAD02_009016 [Eretmocerus hayati]
MNRLFLSDRGNHSIKVGLQIENRSQNKKSKNSYLENIDFSTRTRILIELLDSLIMCFNVSINVTSISHSESSYATEASNELIHALTTGEVDVGLFLLDVDLNRGTSAFGFSLPILHFKRNIYFEPPNVSNNRFMQQFSLGVLLSIAGSFALIVTVMEIINFVTMFIHWQEDEEHFGLGEALIWGLSVMSMQGSPWLPRTRAGRTVLVTSLMFTLIIFNVYSGSIASFLSVKTNPITVVSDFDKFDYTIGFIRIDDNDILKDANLRPFYFRAMEKNQLGISEKDGLQKVLMGKFAFVSADIVARQILSKDLRFQSCVVSELPTNSTGVLALPIAISSPFKKIIDSSILRMWEYGILRKIDMGMKPPLLECRLKEENEHRSFELGDVYGPFFIFAFGFVASLLLFYFEHSWVRRRKLKILVQGIQHQLHVGHASRSQARTRR